MVPPKVAMSFGLGSASWSRSEILIAKAGVSMSKREVRAREILEDLRAGLAEEALREKHHLSTQQLRDLFRELVETGLVEAAGDRFLPSPTTRVQAGAMVGDIRAGLTGSQLMKKHGLSHEGLQEALHKLLTTKILTPSDLPGELSLRLAASAPANIRVKGRCYLDFDLPIIETGPLEIEGRVRDITETGVGVIGIPAQVRDVKTFLIRHDLFVLIQPFSFQAECRWMQETDTECLAGFRISRIAGQDQTELRKLVKIVTLYG
jgi:uncharacterized protein (DUF433 family)